MLEISNDKDEKLKLVEIPDASKVMGIIAPTKPSYSFKDHLLSRLTFAWYVDYKLIDSFDLDVLNFHGITLYKVKDKAYHTYEAAFQEAIEAIREVANVEEGF